MTDITELAQREKFEAWAEECNALPWGYLKKRRIYTGFYSEHTYTSLWAAWKAAGAELVEALEKAQAKIIELQQGCENDLRTHEIIDLQERIAELESRTVKLPPAVSVAGIDVYEAGLVRILLTAAGIKWEAE
ncbi:TPA: hypothetical protein ACN7BE_004489 [Klebsiella pneumoniae]